jgi:hypothetical protein
VERASEPREPGETLEQGVQAAREAGLAQGLKRTRSCPRGLSREEAAVLGLLERKRREAAVSQEWGARGACPSQRGRPKRRLTLAKRPLRERLTESIAKAKGNDQRRCNAL